MRITSIICGIFATIFLYTGFSHAAEVIKGPVFADVVRVIDGDTIEVRARPWIGLAVTVKVRLRGIDTPEMRGKCSEERGNAIRARLALITLIGEERQVILHNVKLGKWAGRVVADVQAKGLSVGDVLITAGHARKYTGRKRKGWC